MNEPFDRERIAQLHLRELTREGGEGLLLERFYLEVEKTGWDDSDKAKAMLLADDVVHLFHAGDKRDDKTYATHVLRVATRLLSGDHFNVRGNPDLIIAALLHDVVEDHPERLLGLDIPQASRDDIELQLLHREQAIAVIRERYGVSVGDMVYGVSNPIYDKTGIPTDERQQIYREHVHHLMSTGGDERLIKLSDFIDNCLGLAYNPQPELRVKLAHKYYGLLDDMRRFVTSSSLDIKVKNDVMLDLLHAQQMCEKYGVDSTYDAHAS